jgi:hypothetical protein
MDVTADAKRGWIRMLLLLGSFALFLGVLFVVVTIVNGGPWTMPDLRSGRRSQATMDMTAALIWCAVGVVIVSVPVGLILASRGKGERSPR